MQQHSATDLGATDVLVAFKLIATAAKYIEGTIEQTVFTACVLLGSVQLPSLALLIVGLAQG